MAQTEAEVARKTDTIMAQADKDGDGVVTFDGQYSTTTISVGFRQSFLVLLCRLHIITLPTGYSILYSRHYTTRGQYSTLFSAR